MSYGSFVRVGHAQLWMPTIGEQRPAEIVASDTNIDLQGCLLTTVIGVPDRCKDTALVIEARKKVELRNANLVGFKVGIYARNCENLVFDNLTFADMFRQRLHSTPDREDARDWLWPHNNDNREWMNNYGACIVLENCKNCVIRNCSARGTQNGIILDKCEGCQVYNNDFSYCSGWGCALWRSSKNTVAQNRFDYCVRGYSHGVYARGQDSAGILVFEQCCDNTFAYNSATHSGDGFFLYAGHETTQRTGKGGCNRNLVYGNDFSYAVANGIEATFSDGNVFARNRIHSCDYGIWGGYSYNTLMSGNEIRHSLNADIAIEHGHNNRIEANELSSGTLGIFLWWDGDDEILHGIYGKTQETRSINNMIASNEFRNHSKAILLQSSPTTSIVENKFIPWGVSLVVSGDCSNLNFLRNNLFLGKAAFRADSRKDGLLFQNCFFSKNVEMADAALFKLNGEQRAEPIALDTGIPFSRTVRPELPYTSIGVDKEWAPGERSDMIIDQWGPIGYERDAFELEVGSRGAGRHWIVNRSSFIVRPVAKVLKGQVRVDLLLEGHERTVPVVVHSELPTVEEYEVRIDFVDLCGTPGVEDNGLRGRWELPPPIVLKGVVLGAEWNLNFWQWTPAEGSDLPPDWDKLVASPPLKTVTKPALDYNIQGGAPEPGVPADHFATVATTEIELPAGSWKLVLTSDDGARLFVDGEKVIERWDIHGPTDDEYTLTLEKPRLVKLRVEHFENTGWAALALRIERK